MKMPSAMLVVDSNIVISDILSRKVRRAVFQMSRQRIILMTQTALVEVRRVQSKLIPAKLENLRLQELLNSVTLVADDQFDHHLPLAATTLAQAVASKNGSMRDAHILACAWEYRADIWSHDRDFAGCGWPSWSTANLRDAVMEYAA
jgi:predicted nucleic acid-binding protein